MINLAAAVLVATSLATATSSSNAWICSELDSHPNDAGVTNVVMEIFSQGYSSKAGAELIVNTVVSQCPEYIPLLQKWADKHG